MTPSCSISSGFQGLKKCAWSLESMTFRLWSLKARLKLELRKMRCRDSESQPRVPWKSHMPKSDLAHPYWTVTEAFIRGCSLLICVCLYIQTFFYFLNLFDQWLFSIVFPFFVWKLFGHWGLHDITEQVFIFYCGLIKLASKINVPYFYDILVFCLSLKERFPKIRLYLRHSPSCWSKPFLLAPW